MLTGKFIHYKPHYIKEELEEMKIPYEEWTNDVCSEVEIRVDLFELNQNQKINLCKIAGVNEKELKNTNFLIFF